MELVDWVNKRREYVRTGPRIDYKNAEEVKEYKQCVHTWIQNNKKEILIQKRASCKKYYPDLWSQTGGGIQHGETSVEAAIRECKEELGIQLEEEKIELIASLKRRFDFLDIYIARQEIELQDIKCQEAEVSEVKWVTVKELKDMMIKGLVADSVNYYFNIIEPYLESVD